MYKLVLLLALIFVQVACQSEKNEQDNRPNIVLIIADDHGTDALGSYGNPFIETPHLDSLAREGTRFASAFATTASCSPSRSVILTGLHNHYNGMYGLSHHPHNFRSFDNIESLPNKLTEIGYRTARIGKFHVAPESVYQFEKVLSVGAANDPETIGRSPSEMADISSGFINEKSEKPFFLLFATDDPHRSNVFTPEGQLTFDTYPNPNPFGNRQEGYPGITEITYSNEEVEVPSYLPDNESTRAELAQYYQSVSRIDQGIGRLIENLKEAGQYENTLIIYVSDNGPAFPASKTTMYEPGIHLPLIVKAPGQTRNGMVQDGLVSLVDLTPTILDYASVPINEQDFHGRSFKELVEKEDNSGWDQVYGSHTMHGINMYYPMRMVRDKKYKLIYNIAYQLPFQLALDLIQSPTWISTCQDCPGNDREFLDLTQALNQSGTEDYFGNRKIQSLINRPKYELYDLENDPDEINNLADDNEYREILQRMIDDLNDFQTRTNDPRLRSPIIE
ncbi:MAG: sulfatase [Balneolales bacterium]